MIKYFLSIIITSVIFLGCKPKPIKINVPEISPKICICSINFEDGGMLLEITKTFSSLGSNDIFNDTTGAGINFYYNQLIVSHAFATITYNGEVDTFENLGDGTYLSSDKFTYISNTNYELFVYDSITKQSVSANSIVQPPILLDTIIVSKKIEVKDSIFTFNYQFEDDKLFENYYMINVSNNSSNKEFSLINNFKSKPSTYLELINDKIASVTDIPGTNNQKINGSFIMSTFKNKMTTQDTLIVSISAIDKAYYEFLTVYKRNGSIINQLTGEPINLPTNVKNGYGYFSTHFANYSSIDLGLY